VTVRDFTIDPVAAGITLDAEATYRQAFAGPGTAVTRRSWTAR
jgi:hypothetical protein